MRWKDRQGSENVEDRRGASPQRLAVGGGFGTIILVVAYLLLGGDPQQLLQQVEQVEQGDAPVARPVGGEPAGGGEDQELKQFVSVVLRDTEEVWRDLFQNQNKQYRAPKLVLFRGRVESACGQASAAVGPFYCPADQNVYLDLGFYQELKTRFGAPGDFAQAYVIAHEIGHHVQQLLGTSARVHAAQQGLDKVQANQLSVRLELQADFYAGVWAHHAQKRWQFLEEGDVDEAMRCAQAIGDDRLQMQSRGVVVPDSFTHGTAAQRQRWFQRGLKTGDLRQGDTFSAEEL